MPQDSLTFSCVPHTDDEQTRAHLETICSYLARAAGVPVSVHLSSSPASLAWGIAEKRIDLAWVSPSLLLTGMTGVEGLVHSIRQGVAVYHGVIFVANEAPLRSAAQLRGKKIAWVAPSSAAGYIFPRLGLASHGLDPRTLFWAEEFCDSHGNVVRAVKEGRADAGATYAVFQDGDAMNDVVRSGYLDADLPNARILFATPPIPSDLVVASNEVSTTVRELLRQGFVRLPEVPEAMVAIRHVIGADGFEPFDDGALDPLRAQIEDGRQLGLLED